jgi:transposase
MATERMTDLTEEERVFLIRLICSNNIEERFIRRAKIVLLAAHNVPITEICNQVGCGYPNALKWYNRFIEKRLDGLNDKPRKGTPNKISELKRQYVLDVAKQSETNSGKQWSVRRIAEHVGLSHSTVQRILVGLNTEKTEKKAPNIKYQLTGLAIVLLFLSPELGHAASDVQSTPLNIIHPAVTLFLGHSFLHFLKYQRRTGTKPVFNKIGE